MSVNGTQAYTATGTYTDTSTQNLTASVTWSSSNTAAATITMAGVATGVAVGSTTIRATSGSISGSTGLTVTLTLVSIAVTPANPSVAKGLTQAFTATGTNPPQQKVKKTAARLSLELDPTPDILAEVGRKKGDRLLVGFAAETQNLVEEARRKMQSKNCDMVVANLVSQQGVGFESDENEVTLVLRTGETIPVERASKISIAHRIFDEMMKLRLALHSAQ